MARVFGVAWGGVGLGLRCDGVGFGLDVVGKGWGGVKSGVEELAEWGVVGLGGGEVG